MTVASYSTDLTDVYAGAGSTTNWSALGGGQAGLNAETDYFIQGTGMTSKNAFASATKGMIRDNTTLTVTAGDCIFIWITHLTSNSLDTQTAGGLQVVLGSGTADYEQYYVAGSDTVIYDDRWLCIPVDPRTGTVSSSNTTGTPTDYSWQGVLAKMVGGPTKGAPLGVDAIRHGRVFTVINGDATRYGRFDDAAQENDYNDVTNGYNRWGQFQESGGVYKMQGLFELGTTTVVDFRDSNRVIFVANTEFVASGFNGFEVNNASSRVDWTNITVQALGTVSRGYFLANDNADINLDTCTFVDMDTFDFLANTSALGCVFRRTNTITAPGSDLTGSTVDSSRVAADAAALVWDVATDPNGLLDDMTFVKGTNAHHAIEFGSNTPTSVTLDGWTVSGFNASNAQNDSVIYNTSGKAITVNVANNTGVISYKDSGVGSSTSIVANPVTTQVTVKTTGGTVIENARVYLEADSGGIYPSAAAVTSITSASTTATVTTTAAHGLATSDQVVIRGATQEEYNGVYTVTVTGASTFTYTFAGSGTSPATGTITTTWVMFEGDLTNASGIVSDSRTFSGSQPIVGWARKASATPYYKTSSFAGTISSSTGLEVNVQMILDE